MKRQLFGGVALGLVVSITVPVLAIAQQPAAQAELSARVEQRKQKNKVQLTNAEATKLGEKCKAAQEKITVATKKIADADKPVQTKYEAHAGRIQKILQKAEVKGVETAQLKKDVDAYNEKYQAMVASVTAFNLSASDLKAIDCKANPTGFKATLQSARAELKQVQTLRKELSELSKGSLLESLKNAKTELAKN